MHAHNSYSLHRTNERTSCYMKKCIPPEQVGEGEHQPHGYSEVFMPLWQLLTAQRVHAHLDRFHAVYTLQC